MRTDVIRIKLSIRSGVVSVVGVGRVILYSSPRESRSEENTWAVVCLCR